MNSPSPEINDPKKPQTRARIWLVVSALLLLTGWMIHSRRELTLFVLQLVPESKRSTWGRSVLNAAVALDGKGLWLAQFSKCRDNQLGYWLWDSLAEKNRNGERCAELDEAGGEELVALMESGSDRVVNRCSSVLWHCDLKREAQVKRLIDSLPAIFRRRGDSGFLAEESYLVASLLQFSHEHPAYVDAPAQIYEKALDASPDELRRYLRGAATCDWYQRDIYQLAIQRFDDLGATLQSELVQFEIKELDKRQRTRRSPKDGFDFNEDLESEYRRLFLRLEFANRIDTAAMIARRSIPIQPGGTRVVDIISPMVTTIFESTDERRFDLALIISEICEGRPSEFIVVPLIQQWFYHSVGNVLCDVEHFRQTAIRFLKILERVDRLDLDKDDARRRNLYPQNPELIVEWNAPRSFLKGLTTRRMELTASESGE